MLTAETPPVTMHRERRLPACSATHAHMFLTEWPLVLGHRCMCNCVPSLSRASQSCFTSQPASLPCFTVVFYQPTGISPVLHIRVLPANRHLSRASHSCFTSQPASLLCFTFVFYQPTGISPVLHICVLPANRHLSLSIVPWSMLPVWSVYILWDFVLFMRQFLIHSRTIHYHRHEIQFRHYRIWQWL